MFVKEKVHGVVSGEKGLSVRNWFPGAWYVRDRHDDGPPTLHLYTENCRGLWTDMGKVCAAAGPVARGLWRAHTPPPPSQVLSAGEVENQSMLISLRLEEHGKLNVRARARRRPAFPSSPPIPRCCFPRWSPPTRECLQRRRNRSRRRACL